MKTIMVTVAALLLAGCASRYDIGVVRDAVREGDSGLWRYQKEQDERIRRLERRVYHLERGELLDYPAKFLKKGTAQ